MLRTLSTGATFLILPKEQVTTCQASTAVDGHTYRMGIDWGRTHDATVFSVLDVTTNELIYLDRMTKTPYETQVNRLKALHGRFRPTVIIAEANSMGQPLIEPLQRDGLPVRPFQTTNATKQAIIDGLTMAFEQETIRILPDETLIDELQAYEMETLPSGLIRYGAPAGLHDDCVMSLALAWQPRRRGTSLV